MHRIVIAGCFLMLAACALGGQQVADAPTVCSIRAYPERYAGREVAIRVVHLTDYFESSALGDPACPNTLALSGGNRAIGEGEWLAAHCSDRIEQGDLVQFTARGVVQYDPKQAISTRFSVLEASEIGYVPAGPFLSNAVDPRSRRWLCPNVLESLQ